MKALELTERLADGIGPRRPTSPAEAEAARVVREALREDGVDAAIEQFDGYSSFAWPYGLLAAMSLARQPLPVVSAALLAAEGGLVHTPLSDALSRRSSANVVATIEPRQEARRTLCLMAHLDSSRSGLLFAPGLARPMRILTIAQSVAITALAAQSVLRRFRAGRAAVRAGRALCVIGLALLAERELRGEDVPGANDNASGAGTVVQLAAECAAQPLRDTRIVVLVAGCEESGLLGSRAFLDSRDTDGWMFLNFDGVAAPATLRYLRREGIGRTWPADERLIALAERLEAERPDLGLREVDRPLGLTYDATAVLARGGRALTLVAGDNGEIPNYHQPTDTVANIDRGALSRALEVGRQLIAMVDRGEAD